MDSGGRSGGGDGSELLEPTAGGGADVWRRWGSVLLGVSVDAVTRIAASLSWLWSCMCEDVDFDRATLLLEGALLRGPDIGVSCAFWLP